MTNREIRTEIRDLCDEDRDQLAERLNKDDADEEVSEGDGYSVGPLL